MHSVLWFSTHHNVTHFQSLEMIKKKQKIKILENAKWLFHKNVLNIAKYNFAVKTTFINAGAKFKWYLLNGLYLNSTFFSNKVSRKNKHLFKILFGNNTGFLSYVKLNIDGISALLVFSGEWMSLCFKFFHNHQVET